ncbi:MAG: tRNA pseudouridine(55) synthase TruB [Pseudomonadota bacterium]
MGRRKRGKPINGWLVLDKAYDVTSMHAVNKARRLFDAQKAGHAGTLDPLATGVLPVAFGEATKTVPYLVDASKAYRFTAKWGVSTTTDDAEGEPLAMSQARPAPAEIEAALPAFIGEIEQAPPAFSAVKVDGQRAYDLARDGSPQDLAPRPVRIDTLRLVETPSADEAVFEMTCGKGAYVRAVVRDLAKALGTEGHVTALRRTRVGPFDEDAAIGLDSLEKLSDNPALMGALRPVSTALDDIPALAVSGGEAQRLRRGQAIVLTPEQAKTTRDGRRGVLPAVLAMSQEQAAAICELDGLTLKPSRVFNL